jgi:hypothetical protein
MRQSLPNAEPAPWFRRPRADILAIVVQHTRLDSRRSEVSMMSTTAYAEA